MATNTTNGQDLGPLILEEKEAEEEVTITKVNRDDVDLKMAPYSEKSFLVWGESTRDFIDKFRESHGRFGRYYTNPEDPTTKIPGWIFSMKAWDQVENLFHDIESGNLKPDTAQVSALRGGYQRKTGYNPAKTGSKTSGKRAPSQVKVPGSGVPLRLTGNQLQMQIVTYSVVKPVVGMKAVINTTDPASVIETKVVQADQNAKGMVEDVYVSLDQNKEDVYKLGIVNGSWQVIGFLQPHTVTFTMT